MFIYWGYNESCQQFVDMMGVFVICLMTYAEMGYRIWWKIAESYIEEDV